MFVDNLLGHDWNLDVPGISKFQGPTRPKHFYLCEKGNVVCHKDACNDLRSLNKSAGSLRAPSKSRTDS